MTLPTFVSLSRAYRSVRHGLFAVFLSTAAWGMDISGVYADKGTQISQLGASTPVEASLTALLNLEFDSSVSSSRYASTSHVAVEQGRSTLLARIYADRTLTSRGRWERQDGFFIHNGQPVLRLYGGRGQESFLLKFEKIGSSQDLLQVTVVQVNPGMLGPAGEVLGTYLFHPLP